MKVHQSTKAALSQIKPKRLMLVVTTLALLIGGGASLLNFKSAAADATQWSAIASGATSCALSEGQAFCWGNTSLIGSTTYGDSSIPNPVDTSGVLAGKTLTAISVDSEFACVLDSTGQAYCWGNNTSGELGDGTNNDSVVPVAVDMSGALSGKTLTSISVGTFSACGIASDHHAYCWGSNELGDGTYNDSNVPVAVDTSGVLAGRTLTAVSVGEVNACALDSTGQAYCWGSNSAGELGNNTLINDSPSPVAVDMSGALSGKTLSSISVGVWNVCALDSTGQAYCWGDNVAGELGNTSLGGQSNGSSSDFTNVPGAVDTSGVLAGKTLTKISAGDNWQTNCALDSDGQAYCWGDNHHGGLGNNSTTGSGVPVAVDTSGALAGKTLTSIVASGENTCALDTDNNAYCWGENADWELGDGDTSSPYAMTPQLVSRVPRITITGVSFSNEGGLSQMEIDGAFFPVNDAYNTTQSEVSLNDTALPFCANFGESAADIVSAWGIDPSLVSDNPPCYFIYDQDGNTNFTDSSIEVWLPDNFDTTAAGTVSVGGSPDFSFGQGGGDNGGNGGDNNSGSGSDNAGQSGSGSSSSTASQPQTSHTPSPTTGTVATDTTTPSSAPTASTDGQDLSDGQTISSTPTFSGTAAPGSTVVVTVHSNPITCTTTADNSGNWSCTLPSSLPSGTHTVYVAVTTPDNQTYNLGPYTVTVKANMPTRLSGAVTKHSSTISPWVYVAIGAVIIIAVIVIVTSARKRSRQAA